MQLDSLQTDFSLLDPTMARNPIHEGIIKRDLTQNLGSLISDVIEELQVGFDEYWGKNTDDWKDAGVFRTMLTIVARAFNRVFCWCTVVYGSPQSRRQGNMLTGAKVETMSTLITQAFLHKTSS